MKKTLLWFTPVLGLDASTGMDLICLLGMILSFGVMISNWFQNKFTFLMLWIFYFSLYQVCPWQFILTFSIAIYKVYNLLRLLRKNLTDLDVLSFLNYPSIFIFYIFRLDRHFYGFNGTVENYLKTFHTS